MMRKERGKARVVRVAKANGEEHLTDEKKRRASSLNLLRLQIREVEPRRAAESKRTKGQQ